MKTALFPELDVHFREISTIAHTQTSFVPVAQWASQITSDASSRDPEVLSHCHNLPPLSLKPLQVDIYKSAPPAALGTRELA